MPDSSRTIRDFYDAFARLDHAAMKACYAEDARFDDPAFSLSGREEIGAMWGMLCEATKAKGRDVWRLEASGIAADEKGGATSGRAHWEAHYRFSATGRMVHNIIEAEFTLHDGLIARHIDRFDFWRWARQALGTPGLLLGWTPFLRNKVRTQAAANLARYRSSLAAPPGSTA